MVERKGWRWLWIGWGTVGLLAALLLVAFNVPGPVQVQARKIPELYRLTTITQLQSGTGKVRGLIWQGTVNLIRPHEPIQYPDGREDRFNALRPLIGYGPESMYVAYNSFYPAELGHYESRTASPDRSHNETLDSLVITGVLGLGVYLFTFISVFYWGFRWLGIVRTWRQLWVYLGLILVFAVSFFVLAWQIEGAYLFAVAIPLGVLVGTMIFMTLQAFRALFIRGKQASADALSDIRSQSDICRQHPHTLVIVGIMASLLAHFVEINFGIAIAATRTTFWALAGLLVVLGLEWVPGLAVWEEETAPPETANGRAQPRSARDRRRARRSSTSGLPAWVSSVLALSLIAVFLLGTLAFDFINNSERLSDGGEIFVRSLTMKYHPEKTQAYGALMLFIFTWFLFGLIGLSEFDRESVFGRQRVSRLGISVMVYAGVSLVGLLIFGSMIAGHQAALTRIQVTTVEQVVEVADELAALLLRYYSLIFTLLVLLGLVLLWESSPPLRWGQPVSLLVGVIGLLASVFIIRTTSYNLIRADIIYKQGGVFANSNNVNDKQIGIAHYEKSLEYVPREDYYNLFLGKAYLELTQGLPVRFSDLSVDQQTAFTQQWQSSVAWDSLSPEQQTQQLQQWQTLWEEQQREQQQALFEKTEVVLTHARELNPLNTDHSANLARFYKSWAARVELDLQAEDLSDAQRTALQSQRRALLQKALENYELALTLSPNNPIIWNEKAQLYAIDLNDMGQFFETITQSLAVDEGFEQTWMLLGDMYSSQGNLEGAVEAYAHSLEITNNCTVRRVMGTLQAQQGAWDDAIETLELALEKCASSADVWDYQRILAIAYANVGRGAEALQMAQQALDRAPDAQKPVVQQLIDSLTTSLMPPETEPTP